MIVNSMAVCTLANVAQAILQKLIELLPDSKLFTIGFMVAGWVSAWRND